MAEQSFIGKGSMYLGPKTGVKRAIGNASALTFAADEEKKDLLDFQNAGGGKANSISRITGVTMDLTAVELSPENIALAIRGSVTAVTAGAVTGEALTAHLDGLVRFANIPDPAVAPVITGSGGTPTYTEGTDYTVVGAGIIPLGTGTITEGLALEAGYTKAAGNVVQAMVDSSSEFEMIFDGLNEAQSGKRVVVQAYRVKFSPGQNVAWIGDNFAELQISGEVLKDTTITGGGLSQFYKVDFQS